MQNFLKEGRNFLILCFYVVCILFFQPAVRKSTARVVACALWEMTVVKFANALATSTAEAAKSTARSWPLPSELQSPQWSS